MGRDGVHKVPGAVVRWGSGAEVFCRGVEGTASLGASVGWAFEGRRDDDRSLGEPAELCRKEGTSRPRDGSARAEVVAGHARVEDGPRSTAVSAESGSRVASQLPGACDHGEPERVGGGGLCNPVERQGRTRSGVSDAGAGKRRPPADHARSRQGVSGTGVPAAVEDAASRTACGGVCGGHENLAERVAQRRAGGPRVCAESEEAEASGAGVRMGETNGRLTADQVSRQKVSGVDVSTSGSSTKSTAYAAPAARRRIAAEPGSGRSGPGNRNFESSQTKQQTPKMEQIENGSFFRSL